MNNNSKKGLTLIEVILAVAIMAIVMLAFSALFNNSLFLSARSTEIDEDSSIAQSALEENGGTFVEDKDLTFTFGTSSVSGNGDVVETTSDDVDYSALVTDGSTFNDTGWSNVWVTP